MFRKFNLTTDFTDSTDSKLFAIMNSGYSFHRLLRETLRGSRWHSTRPLRLVLHSTPA